MTPSLQLPFLRLKILRLKTLHLESSSNRKEHRSPHPTENGPRLLGAEIGRLCPRLFAPKVIRLRASLNRLGSQEYHDKALIYLNPKLYKP